jgi:hypothetical protein
VTYLVEKLRKMSAPAPPATRTAPAGQHGGGVRDAEREHQPGQLRQGRPPALERTDGAGRPLRRGAVPEGRLIDARGANHNDVYLAIARAFGLTLKTVGEPAWCKGPLPGLMASHGA